MFVRTRTAEESRIWMKHCRTLWHEIPEPDVLVMLAVVRRECPEHLREAINYVMQRSNPSPELIALAVAARLNGTT